MKTKNVDAVKHGFAVAMVCLAGMLGAFAGQTNRVWNVADFGAHSGDLLQTAAIQRTIDACYKAGGGEVRIPAGFYKTGCIRLRSRVTLHLMRGAVLEGSRDPEDYEVWRADTLDPILPMTEAEKKRPRSTVPQSRWCNGLIRAYGAHDIAIIGEEFSQINGQNCFDPQGEEGYRGPHAISIWNCTNVVLRGYTIRDSANWAHAIFNSSNITARALTVLGGHDGFDIRTCDDVTVEKCVFESGDDAIAGFDNIGVTIRDCVLNSSCSPLRFGGTDVLVENCTGAPAAWGFRGKMPMETRRLAINDGAQCRRIMHTAFRYYCDFRAVIRRTPGNILVRNCTFTNPDDVFQLQFDGKHIWCCNRSLSSFTYENCVFDGVKRPLEIHGDAKEPLAITLRNCTIVARKGFEGKAAIDARNYKSIRLENTVWKGFTHPRIEARTKGEITIRGGTPLEIVHAEEKGPVAVQPAETFPAYASDSFVPGVTDTATGFFRVVQKDGRWWVIDPLGRGTVLLGVDHITYRGHHSERSGRSSHLEANKAKFPNKADWEADTLRRLKTWGFNMLGADCDMNLRHRGLIHTSFLRIGADLCRKGMAPDRFICPHENRPCSAFPNVFHPDFAAWADDVARRKCAPNKNDPWLFGYFIDNELAWWGRGSSATGLFDAVAALPEAHSAKVAQRKFLAERGVKGEPSLEVKLDFLRLAADIYFRVSSEAIRRHDPNHLVMGARFAGLNGAHPVVWEVSGKYCDVVTFNSYPWADLDRNVVLTAQGQHAPRVTEAFAKQYEYAKRPILITEWSFPALDSGLPCTSGAGQRFLTQKLRTQATELFARTMLSMPYLIGYDYFMWVDEPAEGISDAFPENSNYGLINEQGEAYPEITEMFTKLHRDLAAVRAAGLPPERSAPKRGENGLTAAAFRAKLPKGVAAFTRTNNNYVVRTAAGLELSGRIGGMRMFEAVKLNGRLLGEYTGMWHDRVAGRQGWHNAGKVVAVDWREDDGRGIVRITCEVRPTKTRGMRLTHAITVYAHRPWFFCELVSAENVGSEPIEINSFYFREYSPFAGDKAQGHLRNVPNLWKGPARDAWISATDGAFYGGASFAPTVETFRYHCVNKGKTQYPDAMFTPLEDLTLPPGAVYDPKGTIWMLALCGTGGIEGWKSVIKDVDELRTKSAKVVEPSECVAAANMASRNATRGRGPGPFGDYWWANRFLSRIEQVRAYRGQTVDVVLMGDSIMHFWEWLHPKSWAKFTDGRKVLNCGYGGDRTQSVLWRIAHGELDGYTAKNVVLMIGTNNNVSKKTNPDNVAKAIEKIVAQIKVKQPTARIILHPIFPRGASAASTLHAEARVRNDRTNALLKEFAAAHPEITWVDFNAKLVDETGWVPKAIMADEIHPTDKGYDLWMDALAPVLK